MTYLDRLEHDDGDERRHHEQPHGCIGRPGGPVTVRLLGV